MTLTEKFIKEVEGNLSSHSYSNARSNLAKAVKALKVALEVIDTILDDSPVINEKGEQVPPRQVLRFYGALSKDSLKEIESILGDK